MKKCLKCNTEKTLGEFYSNSNPKFKDGLDTYCKECKKQLSKVYRDKNKEERNRKRRERNSNDLEYNRHLKELQKRNYWNNIEGRLLSSTKSRAKRKGIVFDLKLEDIKIPLTCPILNVKLDKNRYSPTIDRVIPELGYIPTNIKIVSKKANTMKNDASQSELHEFSKNIKSYLNSCKEIVRTYPTEVGTEDKEL